MEGCLEVSRPIEQAKPLRWSWLTMKSVKNNYGLDNLQLMVPFCRAYEEERVRELLEEHSLGPSSSRSS